MRNNLEQSEAANLDMIQCGNASAQRAIRFAVATNRRYFTFMSYLRVYLLIYKC